MWEDYENEFKKWVKFLEGWTVDDLKNRATELYNEYGNTTDDSEEEKKNTVVQSLMGEIKAEMTKSASGTEVIMMILETSNPFNWASAYIKECKKQWSINPEKAIENFYAKAKKNELGEYYDVQWCDYREHKNNGTENKNRGKPFQQTYVRTVRGVFITVENLNSKDEIEDIYRCDLRISGDLAKPSSKKFLHIKLNTWVKTYVKMQKDENDQPLELEGRILIDANDDTNFDTENTDIDLEAKDIAMQWYDDELTTLKDVDTTFTDDKKGALAHNTAWASEHRRGSRKLYVSKINIVEIKKTSGNTLVSINAIERGMFDSKGNEIKPITCWWDEELIPIDFESGSVGYLFYNMNQSENKNIDDTWTGEWGDVQFAVLGFAPTLKKIHEHKEATQTETTVDGEIDVSPDDKDVSDEIEFV